jgi:mono/diheme cytochrome c family protein
MLALGAVAIIITLTHVRLDAIEEPGQLESILATQAKHILVRWYSRDHVPAAPTNLQASIEEGNKVYSTDCSMCHGADGHGMTDTGRGMYPRASDLTSREVRQYTDRELFWIIKNGIRLTGMPGFAKVESDEQIWNLVNYLKTLRGVGARQETGERIGVTAYRRTSDEPKTGN